MKIRMTLISKNVKVEKICNSENEAYIFERDMPAKHGLIFGNIPFVIGTHYIN